MAEKTYIITESWVRRVERCMSLVDSIVGQQVARTPNSISIGSPPSPLRPSQAPERVLVSVHNPATTSGAYYGRIGRLKLRTALFDPTSASLCHAYQFFEFPTTDDAVIVNFYEGKGKHTIISSTLGVAGERVVWGWRYGIAVDGKALIFAENLVWGAASIVYLDDVSGGAGSKTTYATWVYDVYADAGMTQLIASAQSPSFRPLKGTAGAATQGLLGLPGQLLMMAFETVTENWP